MPLDTVVSLLALPESFEISVSFLVANWFSEVLLLPEAILMFLYYSWFLVMWLTPLVEFIMFCGGGYFLYMEENEAFLTDTGVNVQSAFRE